MKTFYLSPITLFFPKSISLFQFVYAIKLDEYEICPAKKCITAKFKEQEIEIAKNKFEASQENSDTLSD